MGREKLIISTIQQPCHRSQVDRLPFIGKDPLAAKLCEYRKAEHKDKNRYNHGERERHGAILSMTACDFRTSKSNGSVLVRITGSATLEYTSHTNDETQ